ncbi:hypothetical protein D1872_170750 [compost metagenome]
MTATRPRSTKNGVPVSIPSAVNDCLSAKYVSSTLASTAWELSPSETTICTLGLCLQRSFNVFLASSPKRRPKSGRRIYSCLLFTRVTTLNKFSRFNMSSDTVPYTASTAAAWSKRNESHASVLGRSPARPIPIRAGVCFINSASCSLFLGLSTPGFLPFVSSGFDCRTDCSEIEAVWDTNDFGARSSPTWSHTLTEP